MSADAILTSAHAMRTSQLRPFVKSLRRVYDGEAIVFISDLREDAIRFLIDNHMRVVPVLQEAPWILSGTKHDLDFLRLLHVACTRFIHWYSWLKENTYERIMLTDMRDVVFQANPFGEWDLGDKLYVPQELPSKTIGECQYNTRWLEQWFPAFLDPLRKKPILCAGTAWGNQQSVFAYCQRQIAAMATAKTPCDWGFDQAVLNIAARFEAQFKYAILPYESPRVRTIGYEPAEQLKILEGQLCNSDGELVATIHQYDRPQHAALREQLGKITS